MSELWIIGLPILLVDIINPVLLTFVVLALTGDRPLARSCAVIAGHTLAYMLVGVLVVKGLADLLAPVFEILERWFTQPTPANFVAGFVIGVLLIGVAVKSFFQTETTKPDEVAETNGVWSSVLLGATINIIGAPFALPYIGFINELFRFEIDAKVTYLLVYNLLYALPFLLFPVMFALFGRKLLPLFQSINNSLAGIATILVPLVLGALGIAFVIDAILYLFTGNGLV